MSSSAATPGSAVQRATRDPVRVLLVLETRLVVELVKLTLNHGAYLVEAVPSAAEAVARLPEMQPHLVILNMDLDGQWVMQQIQASNVHGVRLPVIGLTRRGDLKTKLAAFDAGVDDILTMPFSPEELLARVIALVRRSYPDRVTFKPTIRLGALEIDILRRTVRAGSAALHLTSLEQSLLYLLAANAGRVVTREEILDTLWGVDYVAESNVVDRQIRNLRARLQHDPRQPGYIETVPGRGYRFLPPSSPDGAQETLRDLEDHFGSRRNSPSTTHELSRLERARRPFNTPAITASKRPSLHPRG